MSKHALRPEGPSPESYSRVTNANRFADLHRIALEQLAQPERGCAVHRSEPPVTDSELGGMVPARPPVRLEPASTSAAPILIVFTAFPGLVVRAGRWVTDILPACGCDACAATLEGESQRFR